MATICGADCSACGMQEVCRGCMETDGHPFGGECIAAECCKKVGKAAFCEFKKQLIEEFTALGISDMPFITELFQLNGSYVNLEYQLPNGQKVRLLKDNDVYLGTQLEKNNSDRFYGLVTDKEYLLVGEYGRNGETPQIIVYKKR